MVGLEPTTCSLRKSYSTTELHRHFDGNKTKNSDYCSKEEMILKEKKAKPSRDD